VCSVRRVLIEDIAIKAKGHGDVIVRLTKPFGLRTGSVTQNVF
jgi:hypothetical protein